MAASVRTRMPHARARLPWQRAIGDGAGIDDHRHRKPRIQRRSAVR